MSWVSFNFTERYFMQTVKIILATLLLPSFFCLLSILPVRADNGPCQGIISVYCTRCHTTERICDTLGSDEAAWKALIREMAEYDGDLDQETQDQVLNCVVGMKKGDPAVCNK